MSIYYSDVLTEMYAGSEWSMSNEDYSTLEWLSDSVKPTQKELDDKMDATAKLLADKELAKQNAKKAAEAKLAALGLTTDDLKALGL
jgi:hypothetical protein